MGQHQLTAKAGFTNPSITGPREGGAVLEGETFSTDYLHAKELVANGLAEPVEAGSLDVEPTDPVEAHHGLSVAEHTKVNRRRAAAAGGAGGDGGGPGGGPGGGNDGGDRTKAAAAALERVKTARKALDEADQAVKEKPSSAARAKLADAQAEYDAAEAEAKGFTGT